MFPRGRMVFARAEPEGKTILPRGDIPSGYPHWHGIFVLLYRTNPVCNCKQSKVTDDWWFTHSPLSVASGNGQHEALTDGIRQHDDCSLLSQPITAYDLKVRYNNKEYDIGIWKVNASVISNESNWRYRILPIKHTWPNKGTGPIFHG